MADLVASMPLLVLEDGGYVRFEAVDPTTGNPVAGVVATAATFTAIDMTGAGVTQPDVVIPKPDPNYFANEEMA